MRTKAEAKAIQRKGGQSKSPAKQAAARLNGLLSNKNLSKDTVEFARAVRDGRIAEVIYDLVTMNYEEGKKDPKRRDAIIAQLQSMMPKTNVNVNLGEDHFMKVVMEVLTTRGLHDVIEEIRQELEVVDSGPVFKQQSER